MCFPYTTIVLAPSIMRYALNKINNSKVFVFQHHQFFNSTAEHMWLSKNREEEEEEEEENE